MIRASDLIGCDVRTESGEKLGRVHDLRAQESDGEWLLLGIVVGRGGVVARLVTGATGDDPVRDGRVLPWEAVTRLADGAITVRDEVGAAPG
jgi:sporulation protein YlmC with PRC-barrel domain